MKSPMRGTYLPHRGGRSPSPVMDPFPEHALFESIGRWQRFMRLRGRSEQTVAHYRRCLVRFVADTLLDLRSVTEDDVVEYLSGITTRAGYRDLMLKALRSYYSWAADTEAGWNPVRRLKSRSPKLTPAPSLPPEHETRLVIAAHAWEPRRGWAILFALRTGGRISSLCALRPEDIREGHVFFAEAKGDRPYSVPLTRDAEAAARELVKLGHDTLFGVGPGQFRNWVHQAERDAQLPRVWPHLLRHTFAHRVRRATGDPVVTAALLNHRDLSQMPRYAWADDREKAEGLSKAFG